MVKDILLNKFEIIERCILRVKEVYNNEPDNLKDYTKQDSIILNIQRAVEATIDIAMFIVSNMKLGIPQNSRDAFEALAHHNIIDNQMLEKLKNMIGFRYVAVHNYQKINIDILKNIIELNLEDFKEFIFMINQGNKKENI